MKNNILDIGACNHTPGCFFTQKKRMYLFFILFIGIALRMYRLGFNYFWHDEVCSIFGVEAFAHSVSTHGLFSALSYNFVFTPVFCLLLKIWRFLGDTEFTLRLLPLIFGSFSIIVIYKLGKKLFSDEAGLFSALLLSIAPFHIYHSQELRMYSLIGLSGLLSVYYLLKALDGNKNGCWALYIIFNLINLYTHHMTIFVLLAQVCFFLTYYGRHRGSIRKWLISHVLILILMIPWMLNIFFGSKFNFTTSTFYLHPLLRWVLPPSAKSFFWVLKNFSIGFNAGRITYILATASFLSLAIFGTFKSPKKENLFLALYLLFLPLVMIFIVSQFKYCFVIRYFYPGSFFYYILAANGFTKIKQNFLKFLILMLVFISTIFALNNYYANYMPGSDIQFLAAVPRFDIKGSVTHVKENFQEGDIICHTDGLTLVPFEYYLNFKKSPNYIDYLNRKRDRQLLLFMSGKQNNLTGYEYTAGFLPSGFKEMKEVFTEKNKRVWLIHNQQEIFNTWDKSNRLGILRWLDRHYWKKEAKSFGEISVYLYYTNNPDLK